ncbi:MAG: ABC transporter permease, partial [Bacteroidales bacterium]|nr:ABC transporter permease [Bacteroidales bacterium]
MFKNFIIISFRNLVRKRGFALINLMGLTMGLSVSFLILLYVFNELSYDKQHPASDRLYRIAVTGNLGEMPLNVAVTPGALAHNLADQMPEIEAYCMFEHLGGDQLFRSGDNKFYENHLVYADENLFKLFAFDFLYGDPETSLDKPYNLILRKSISEKFFGEVNSLGKTIRLNNDKDYIVTGIIEDPPEESHLAINIIASFETRISENGTTMLEDWGSMMYYSYIRLKEGTNLEDFVQKMNVFFNENLIKEFDDDRISVNPYLQAVTDIHLNSRLLGEIKPNSELSYVYILSLIAAAILFIAGINFMNLATARSASRAREVGIRKIVGSNRKKLIFQFVGESVFMSTLAFLLSLVLIELLLPVFNNVTHKNIEFSYYFNSSLLIIFVGISLFIGIFSGSYPAFYLSAFNPIKVLQSKLRSGSSNKSLRNILVFIQFAISSSLIACTIVIYNQLNFMQEKSLGFDKDNLIAIFLRNDEVKSGAHQLKNEFRSQAVVESSSLASSIPGMSLNG